MGFPSYAKLLPRCGIARLSGTGWQNGIIIIPHPHLVNLASNGISLFIIGIGRTDGDFAPFLLFRINGFLDLLRVLMDQAVCRIHNILCRTVIPFQFENTATRILVLELQDIIDIGSSERIDTLRIIPNHTDTPMHFAQTLNDQMLCKVRILILVHQHKLEKAPVFLNTSG